MVELPRVARSIEIGGRTWAVETVEDEEALLAAAETRKRFPFGLMLWESAVALAGVLAAEPGLVAGRTVLELGCGIGLSGVVAASLGGRVVATDHDEAALMAARRTAAANGVSTLDTANGDWHDWRVPGRFDVILGADVAYDGEAHTALLDVLHAALAKGGKVLLADPGRTAQAAFLTRAAAAGWHVRAQICSVPEIKPSQAAGRHIPVSILWLGRAFSDI